MDPFLNCSQVQQKLDFSIFVFQSQKMPGGFDPFPPQDGLWGMGRLHTNPMVARGGPQIYTNV